MPVVWFLSKMNYFLQNQVLKASQLNQGYFSSSFWRSGIWWVTMQVSKGQHHATSKNYTDKSDNCPIGRRSIETPLSPEFGRVSSRSCFCVGNRIKCIGIEMQNICSALAWTERVLYVCLVPKYTLMLVANTFGVCPLGICKSGGISILQTTHRYIK